MVKLPDILSALYRPATDKEIRSWSFGEVQVDAARADLSWQSLRRTLFDQAIFGPLQDNECACGKYRGPKYRGMVCEICGVKVTAPTVRRERFGHITLAAPIEHPLAPSEAVLSVLPVLPAILRESSSAQEVDKRYAKILTSTDEASLRTIVHTLFQQLLPVAVVATQWNLAEKDTLARGLALTIREDELVQP